MVKNMTYMETKASEYKKVYKGKCSEMRYYNKEEELEKKS